jgi:hypothetical protein
MQLKIEQSRTSLAEIGDSPPRMFLLMRISLCWDCSQNDPRSGRHTQRARLQLRGWNAILAGIILLDLTFQTVLKPSLELLLIFTVVVSSDVTFDLSGSNHSL